MKLSRRMFAALAALTFTFLLTACQPGAEQTAPSPDPGSSPVQDTPPQSSPAAAPVSVPEEDGNGGQPLADIDRALSLYEIGLIDEWLSTGACAVLHSAPFDDPDDIDLAIVLHDGIDVYYGQPKMIFTGEDQEDLAEDRKDLAEVGVDLDKELGNMVGIKLTGAQIHDYLERILGITLTDEELQQRVVEQSKINGWLEWHYVPETDTYYHFSNGTASVGFKEISGSCREDGTLTVECYGKWPCNYWSIELEPTGDGYHILSAWTRSIGY